MWLIIVCLSATSTCSSFKAVWHFCLVKLWLNMCRNSFSKMMHLVILKCLFPHVANIPVHNHYRVDWEVLQNFSLKNNALFELDMCGRTSESSNFLFLFFLSFSFICVFFICTTVIWKITKWISQILWKQMCCWIQNLSVRLGKHFYNHTVIPWKYRFIVETVKVLTVTNPHK